MEIGQTVKARFKTIPSLLKGKSTADEETCPVRTGKVVYIHPEGRFLSVRTHTPGGDITENFRENEIAVCE